MCFDNPLDKRQADTSAFTFGIQLVEQAKDFFMVVRINTLDITQNLICF
jgi:hypothetical protein